MALTYQQKIEEFKLKFEELIVNSKNFRDLQDVKKIIKELHSRVEDRILDDIRRNEEILIEKCRQIEERKKIMRLKKAEERLAAGEDDWVCNEGHKQSDVYECEHDECKEHQCTECHCPLCKNVPTIYIINDNRWMCKFCEESNNDYVCRGIDSELITMRRLGFDYEKI